MGRGRQKAKQTKVARELKYYTPNTDLNALQKELGTANADHGSRYTSPASSDDDEGDTYDPYEDWTRRSG